MEFLIFPIIISNHSRTKINKTFEDTWKVLYSHNHTNIFPVSFTSISICSEFLLPLSPCVILLQLWLSLSICSKLYLAKIRHCWSAIGLWFFLRKFWIFPVLLWRYARGPEQHFPPTFSVTSGYSCYLDHVVLKFSRHADFCVYVLIN